MKFAKFIFIFLFTITAQSTFAQSKPLQPAPLKFNTTSASAISKNGFSIQHASHSPMAIDPVVHYPAFFCRMELRSVSQLGICIKLHAGDYDAYSRSASAH